MEQHIDEIEKKDLIRADKPAAAETAPEIEISDDAAPETAGQSSPETPVEDAPKPIGPTEAGEKKIKEQQAEAERDFHEKVLERAEKDFAEIKADFERRRLAVVDALNDPVLSRYAAAEKKDVKELLRDLPRPKSFGAIFEKLTGALEIGTGGDPGRSALRKLDEARRVLAQELEKIDLATQVIREKAAAEDGLDLAEQKRRYEARSKARTYDGREGKLLKDIKDFRKEVYSFCHDHEIGEAKRFLEGDMESENLQEAA